MHRVFVYGTLKRGFPYFAVAMRRHRYLGRGRTREAYPLVIAGRWFSPTLIDEPGVGWRVVGELFHVDARGLDKLDAFEGAGLAGGYRRQRIAVDALEEGATHLVWVYVKDRADVDVIHSEMLAEYPLDPRYVPAAKR